LRNNGSLDQFASDSKIGHAQSLPIGGVTNGRESGRRCDGSRLVRLQKHRIDGLLGKGGDTPYLQAAMMISRSNDVDTRREDGGVATIRIGTFNIRNGRSGNLESALRAMGKMNMDIVLFTETKLTGGRHIK
jgi:hypothetical protein